MSFEMSKLAGLTAFPMREHQGQRIHTDVYSPLLHLQKEAASAGFELGVASGFRSFDRQQRIWDDKANGRRAVLSDQGLPLDIDKLAKEQLLHAILRWSALPGTSRHHWGTDFDVFDKSALSANACLQLTLEETQECGPFYEFHQWLSDYLEQSNCVFFRPYTRPKGGVAPEPWHLSYAPLSSEMQKQFNLHQFSEFIADSNIALKDLVLDQLDAIYSAYVWVPWSLYPEAYRE